MNDYNSWRNRLRRGRQVAVAMVIIVIFVVGFNVLTNR